jgi:hypothetical protein
MHSLVTEAWFIKILLVYNHLVLFVCENEVRNVCDINYLVVKITFLSLSAVSFTPNKSKHYFANTGTKSMPSHYRNKRREYFQVEDNELEEQNKNNNVRHLYTYINDFMQGYQPRTEG